MRTLGNVAGLSLARSSDFGNGVATPEAVTGADGIVFQDLGIAVVNAQPDQMRAMDVSGGGDILAVEPERIVYAIAEQSYGEVPRTMISPPLEPISIEYFRGYRDAVNQLCDRILGPSPDILADGIGQLAAETEFTWGLHATKVPTSRFTGRDIRVAVLDTGLDLAHPDFGGRHVQSKSFVAGEPVQDGHGHGTHCVGTACGPRRPGTLPRYGVAFEAEVYAGKVLSNRGSGSDSGILAGIQWGITNKCAVVSLSLGAPVQLGQPFSQVFEHAARRALEIGTLLIAAAGNDSGRPGRVEAVSHPANCPSIMAVGAIDRNMQVASFSNGGLNPQGGQIDIAGPGIDVRSSWPRPRVYNTISGTSMATPHVAGIAALWAESNANYRGRSLMSVLTQSARRMSLPARDIGSGLVQAP
jgi:subtilisin